MATINQSTSSAGDRVGRFDFGSPVMLQCVSNKKVAAVAADVAVAIATTSQAAADSTPQNSLLLIAT